MSARRRGYRSSVVHQRQVRRIRVQRTREGGRRSYYRRRKWQGSDHLASRILLESEPASEGPFVYRKFRWRGGVHEIDVVRLATVLIGIPADPQWRSGPPWCAVATFEGGDATSRRSSPNLPSSGPSWTSTAPVSLRIPESSAAWMLISALPLVNLCTLQNAQPASRSGLVRGAIFT